ncbi:hypothetical protein [Polaromonas sp.]|uniref:hypothetical protein n=1 Tax=Polaromonas sp. TaxID=1869339 RepID=UPI00286B5B47|nr:hypothetical protein [Polaromonas sp.]
MQAVWMLLPSFLFASMGRAVAGAPGVLFESPAPRPTRRPRNIEFPRAACTIDDRSTP